MTHDLIKLTLLDPERGEEAKTACAALQQLLAHGNAREISLKEKEVDAFHGSNPELVSYPQWKRYTELLQHSLSAESDTITGFLVSPDVLNANIMEIRRLGDEPSLKPIAAIFQKAARTGQWVLQTVPREDI